MDISTLTLTEVKALLDALNLRYSQLISEQAQEERDAKRRIGSTISRLDALIGPEDAKPGLGSIRAVRAYGVDTIAENAGLAIMKVLDGLEALAATSRDIALVVGDQAQEDGES